MLKKRREVGEEEEGKRKKGKGRVGRELGREREGLFLFVVFLLHLKVMYRL